MLTKTIIAIVLISMTLASADAGMAKSYGTKKLCKPKNRGESNGQKTTSYGTNTVTTQNQPPPNVESPPPRQNPTSGMVNIPTQLPSGNGKVLGATVKVYIHPSALENRPGWTAELRRKAEESLKAAFILMNKSYTRQSFGRIKLLFTGFGIEYLPASAVPVVPFEQFCGKNQLRDYLKNKGETLGDYTLGLYITECRGGWSLVGGSVAGCGLNELQAFPVVGYGGLLNGNPERLHRIMRHEFGHWFGSTHDGNRAGDVTDNAGNTCVIGQGPDFAPNPIMGRNGDDYWSTCSRDTIQRYMEERYSKCDRFQTIRA